MKKLYPTSLVIFTAHFTSANPVISSAVRIDGSCYEVESIENGSAWAAAITKIAADGNTLHNPSYSYTDKNVSAHLTYCRILHVYIDRRFTMTEVHMKTKATGNTEIRMNASSSNSLYVHFSETAKGSVIVRLASPDGQIVSQKLFDQPVGSVMMSIQGSMTVTDGRNSKLSKQVLL